MHMSFIFTSTYVVGFSTYISYCHSIGKTELSYVNSYGSTLLNEISTTNTLGLEVPLLSLYETRRNSGYLQSDKKMIIPFMWFIPYFSTFQI